MRVSKIIEQYVRDEVHKKFQPLIDDIDKPLREKRDELDDVLKCIFENYYNEVNKAAAALGFDELMTYKRGDSPPYHLFNSRSFHVVGEEEINKKRRDICDKRDATIHEILLSLELGSAKKSELNDILAAVTVENVD